jgi:ABC-type multidrug/protein/lipid transport system, ATPase component
MYQYIGILFKKNKIKFILSIVFSVIISFFNIMSAIILKNFIDIAIEGNKVRLNSLLIYSLLYIIGFLFVSFISSYFKKQYVSKAYNNLRTYFIETLFSKKISFLNQLNSSKYSTFFSSDLEKMRLDFIDNIIVVFQNVVTLLLSLSIMVFFDIHLFIGILFTSIISSLIGGIFQKMLPKSEKLVKEYQNTVSKLLNDIIGGFHTIKLFRAENIVTEICKDKLLSLESYELEKEKILNLSKSFSAMSTNIMVFILFYIGASQVMEGKISFGTIVAYIQLLNFIVVPIQIIPESILKFQSVNNILENVEDLLYIECEQPTKSISEDFKKDIRFANVSFKHTHSDTYALKDISLKFEYGKKYIIVGQSGSGKTTLLNLLQKFWTNYSGSITIGENDVKNINEEVLYRNISVMQQEVFIFDDSILNNITLFSNFDHDFLEEVIIKSQLKNLVDKRGLHYKCGENGRNLSGGEKQRVAIARALLQKSPIIVFDEATSSLDNKTTNQIEEVLLDMNQVTQIVISHRLNKKVLEKFDQIIVMKNGQIVETGNFEDLIDKKMEFWALYKINN